MTTCLTLIHALSPLHAGTGQAVGAIDLPIARERPTGIPLLPGSSLKGALRARVQGEWRFAIFGPDTPNASEHSGSVQFADAHLLLLPVRSLWGTFAWVTSPYLLQRFARDAREAGIALPPLTPASSVEACLLPPGSALRGGAPNNKVILEDLDFTATEDTMLSTLVQKLDAWLDWDGPPNVGRRLCVVHDDIMSTLMETATEVCARIRLNESSKTVDRGALWYEESLPTESVLFGLAIATGVPKRSDHPAQTAEELLARVNTELGGQTLQLGGKATVGRGVCRMRLVGGAQ
jgi:CRISPR-associated protein Cmr4